MKPTIRFLRDENADAAISLPSYETAGAAGADVRANFPPDRRGEGVLLAPMTRALVPTGLRLEIPEGYEVQVRPRSGLAFKHGIGVVNAPGTIDSDYRGQLGILLINLGHEPFDVEHGERIAQLVISPVVQARFEEADSLLATSRGEGGFGSTGRG